VFEEEKIPVGLRNAVTMYLVNADYFDDDKFRPISCEIIKTIQTVKSALSDQKSAICISVTGYKSVRLTYVVQAIKKLKSDLALVCSLRCELSRHTESVVVTLDLN
jgi:hypothetical protein